MFASDARDTGTAASEGPQHSEGARPPTIDELTFRYELSELSPSSGLVNRVFTKTLPLPSERDVQRELGAFLHEHRWTFASLGAHVVMLACFALMPPKSSALAIDMLNEDLTYARYLTTPVEREQEETELPAFDAGAAKAGEASKGEAGQIGETTAPKQKTRGGMGMRGAPTPMDAREEAKHAGILGVLSAGGVQNMQDLSVFSQADKFGYGSDDALGVVLGNQLGSNQGFGGLTMRGTGRSGGGNADGTLAVGVIGGGLDRGLGGPGGTGVSLGGLSRKAQVPRVRLCSDSASSGCSADVHGSMSKESIRRVIQRHMNEVRFCYEEGLRKQPDLAGRVQVSFMISPSGVVTSATVADSSLHNAQVESCVAQAARRWTFPAPDGGGYVAVRYPFLLEQAGQ